MFTLRVGLHEAFCGENPSVQLNFWALSTTGTALVLCWDFVLGKTWLCFSEPTGKSGLCQRLSDLSLSKPYYQLDFVSLL